MSDNELNAELPVSRVVVESIDDRFACIRLPDGQFQDWLLSTLPEGIREGDILLISGEGDQIEVDLRETIRHRLLA